MNTEVKKYNDDFFRTLVEGLDSEIFVCDAEGEIVYMNPASEVLTGKKSDHLLGHHIQDMLNNKVISYSVTKNVMETGKICKGIQRVASGKDLLAIGIPIYNEENKIEYILTSAYDTGELSQINSMLAQKNEELQQQMESMEFYKDQFLSDDGLIYVGEVMEALIASVRRIAFLDVIVLILGETGVGKEGIAKMVHKMGKRKNSPFVKINCGMIPEPLFESELFGYEEGAFTGAMKGGKKGKVELAHEGTLFFDEIGELPLSMQVKLLEFLQEKTIMRVGGVKRIPVDTRIVAATHRDLKKMCDEGSFRQDLYYRLNVVPLEIPPLRKRTEEIIHLAQFMLYKCNRKYNLEKFFNKDITEALKEHDWPGNLRELEHIIERLYITVEGRELTAKALREYIGVDGENPAHVICTGMMPLKMAKAEVEKQLVLQAYKETGSTYKAARLLKIDQSTVVKLMKKHQE